MWMTDESRVRRVSHSSIQQRFQPSAGPIKKERLDRAGLGIHDKLSLAKTEYPTKNLDFHSIYRTATYLRVAR
jgi:hypothetical protein